MKIVTIVGTRPEIIKMSVTIKELDKNFNNIIDKYKSKLYI